jgi:hypothetical protein
LVKVNQQSWTVKQYNPAKTFILSRKEWSNGVDRCAEWHVQVDGSQRALGAEETCGRGGCRRLALKCLPHRLR